MKRFDCTPPNHVRAVFEDTAFAFDLRKGATVAELAEALAALGRCCGERPLYVEVRVRS